MYGITGKDFEAIRKDVAGLTQDAFAKSLGISKWSVKKYEKETLLPSLTLLAKIATVYGVTFKLPPNSEHPLLKQDAPAAE